MVFDKASYMVASNIISDTRYTKNSKSEGKTLVGGAIETLLDITGAGKITTIFLVIGALSTYSAYTSRIKIYIDSATPVVDVPAQDFFFSRGFTPNEGDGTHWQSDRIGMSKNLAKENDYRLGFYRYLDMPFTTSCKVTLSNGDGVLSLLHWCQIYYKLGESVLDRLIGAYNISYIGSGVGVTTGRVTTPYETVELLNLATGSGKLESIYMVVYQNPGEPWIEGNFNFFIDGEQTPSIASSGTEDFFMSAFAWVSAYQTLNHGCVIRDGSGYTNVYRFLIPESITFNNGIKVTWSAGDVTQGVVNGNLELWSSVGYYLDF